MPVNDEWGQDPNVRAMRLVFSALEKKGDNYLSQLQVDPWSLWLGDLRIKARDDFEKTWPIAIREGLRATPDNAGDLYVCCLELALEKKGILKSEEFGSLHSELKKFIKKTLS